MGFVDVGTKLPFFLSEWTHRHRIIKKSDQESIIMDDISYSGGGVVLSLLLYPALWLQFVYRRPIYKKWFAKKA
jgi:ligand-binding SRPBCC domain-containing protein